MTLCNLIVFPFASRLWNLSLIYILFASHAFCAGFRFHLQFRLRAPSKEYMKMKQWQVMHEEGKSVFSAFESILTQSKLRHIDAPSQKMECGNTLSFVIYTDRQTHKHTQRNGI